MYVIYYLSNMYLVVLDIKNSSHHKMYQHTFFVFNIFYIQLYVCNLYETQIVIW